MRDFGDKMRKTDRVSFEISPASPPAFRIRRARKLGQAVVTFGRVCVEPPALAASAICRKGAPAGEKSNMIVFTAAGAAD